MLRQIFDVARQLLLLTRDLQENKTAIRKVRRDINDINQELKQLRGAVHGLAFEIRRVSENDVHEREKLALRLENTLLQFERRLPADKSGPKRNV